MRTSLFLASLAVVAATTASIADASMLTKRGEHNNFVNFERRDPATAKYPAALQTPPKSSLPQPWVDALNALIQQGKIPDIPASKADDASGDTAYPSGTDMKAACSWTVSKCFGKNDIHEAADGHWTISFDDGPTAVSTGLYDYLHQHNQPGTHFMIGSQILAYKDAAIHAAQTQQQLAVHTWSHSLQTTKNNFEVLGELGWTMQIIYDLTGRVPNLWRPPQGDIDNRVRAIAEGVFNLTAVMWDAECNDWCIQDNGKSACPGEKPGQSQNSVANAINKALAQPKSPGVMILEHELNKYTVGFFEDYFPTLNDKGWTATNVPDQFGMPWYSNAQNNDDKPVNVTSMVFADVQKAVQAQNNTPGASKKAAAVSSGSSSAPNSTATNLSSSQSQHSGARHTLVSAMSFTGTAMIAILMATIA